MFAEAAEPQRVADDGDRTGGHRDGGEHGRQDPGGGQRDEHQVVAEGPAEVLADDPAGGAGQQHRVGDGADAAVDQGDVGGGHRRAGPGGDRDAYVGGGQRGCVVDAVADHGDRAPLTPQFPHEVGLILREQPGPYGADAGGAGDGVGRCPGVAGGQHRLQPEAAEPGDALRAVGAQRVGDAEQQPQAAIDGDGDRGLGGAGQLGGQPARGRGVHAGVGEPGQRPGLHLPGPRRRGHAAPGHGLDVLGAHRGEAAVFGGCHDRAGEGVLGGRFRPGGQRERFAPVAAIQRLDAHDSGMAHGQGAGLVQHDGCQPVHPLQALAAPDEEPELGTAPGAGHDRDWRGQAERAGAGDDQHGNGGDQRRHHPGAR